MFRALDLNLDLTKRVHEQEDLRLQFFELFLRCIKGVISAEWHPNHRIKSVISQFTTAIRNGSYSRHFAPYVGIPDMHELREGQGRQNACATLPGLFLSHS